MKLTITAFQVDFGDGRQEYLTADIKSLNKGEDLSDPDDPTPSWSFDRIN